jgi:predicted enzyme related to lactoylglutathione lyase
MSRVVHFEIHATDPDRAERFYRDVFGWEIEPPSAGPDYRLVRTGPPEEPGIDGAITRRDGEPPNGGIGAYVCTVQVDDVQDTGARVIAAGGQQVSPPRDIPSVGTQGYFRDTEGNVFGALQAAE